MLNLKKNNFDWSLKQDAHIAIIGAGPAGCFFAIHALRMSKEKNLNLKISIFDAKNFLRAGPPGCNMCVGVISENLVKLLEQNEVYLDSPRIQRKISSYYLQTPHHGIQLHHRNWIRPIYSVFRGNGPRFSSPDQKMSFDDFLLQQTISRGAEYIPEQVTGITLPTDPTIPACLLTNKQKKYSADLIVGAFGLHSSLFQKIAQMGQGYAPPKMISTLMAELPLPEEWIKERFQNRIIVYLFPSKRTRYVITVPKKKRHSSICIINRKDADLNDLKNFLNSEIFAPYLPEYYPRFCS